MARDKKTGLMDKPMIDGEYFITEIEANLIASEDFSSERDMCDYIERNIQLFCIDVLGDIYKSHKREFELPAIGKGRVNRRVDFYIRCEKDTYVIEAKNPHYKSELSTAIGQILTYSILIKEIVKYVIVTTKYDHIAACSIQKYKLPIDLIIFSKAKYLRYVSGS